MASVGALGGARRVGAPWGGLCFLALLGQLMRITSSSCTAVSTAVSYRQQSLGREHRGTPKPHNPWVLMEGKPKATPPRGPILALGGLCLLAAASSLPTQRSYLSRAVGGVGGCRMEGWGCLLVLGAAVLLGECPLLRRGGGGTAVPSSCGDAPRVVLSSALSSCPGRSGDPFPMDPQLQNPLSWMGRVGALL